MTADRVIGILFALVGTGMFYTTQQIVQPFAGSGDPGPRLLPTILSAAMVLLGAALALRGVPVAPAERVAIDPALLDGPTELLPPPSLLRRLGIAGSFIAFLALFEPLGFTASATLFLAVSMSLMDELTPRRILTRSVVAVVMVLLVGLLLSWLLQLPVPGIWFV
ncbi:tripartite tricarboxylate transporter TctB family protein [Pseudotabrizicola sp. 4114]|uniref:tripartite tricarboxylate transporter TctB family protein n=1 Tax=Pseudotabrizicola sp. 4114 TaxID=2817731 RepID=UPI002866D773|nr:hypothetical protein [Pseudorhodobacter sp. 4114]